MTYEEFITALRKNDIKFDVANEGTSGVCISIRDVYVLIGEWTFVKPMDGNYVFQTSADAELLKELKESDMMPMIDMYHGRRHNPEALKLLSRFTLTRDGLVKYIREDGHAIYGKDAVKLFKKDMKPIL